MDEKRKLTMDWQTPWFKPLKPWGAAALERWHGGQALCEALNACRANAHHSAHAGPGTLPRPSVTFVPQAALPKDMAYETFIHQAGQVPTREHVHDFFNAMSWCRWPQTKALIGQAQAQAIAEQFNAGVQEHQSGVATVRGVLRDALTLIDESGVFLSCSDAMWQALCEHRWTDLFVTERAAWAQAHTLLVGHALLEKLVNPYKSITAQVLRVGSPGSDSALVDDTQWDAAMAAALTQALQLDGTEPLLKKPFQVLPLMGIPGWSKDQSSPGYFEDKRVFRGA